MRHCARAGGAEEKRKPTMNREQILHISYRKCQPPGLTTGPSALLRKLQHALLGLEHIFGGELYVAPDGVALPLPEGLDHGRGEAHGTRGGRAPDAEGVGVQVARGRECTAEDVLQAGPGQE